MHIDEYDKVLNRTDYLLSDLMDTYSKSKKPISVNFRELVNWLPAQDRLTHLIHPYPAKLLMHIPHFFLSNDMLSSRRDLVYDPFCGSGTVMLEAMVAGRDYCGADVNPLSRLISKVKTHPINPALLEKYSEFLSTEIAMQLKVKSCELPSIANINHWYYPHAIKKLCAISRSIEKISKKDIREFYLVCFSVCARKVSLADPRLSVPVRLREGKYSEGHWLHEKTNALLISKQRTNVVGCFFDIVNVNIERMASIFKINGGKLRGKIQTDARGVIQDKTQRSGMVENSAQLIITSPPYAGAQKYVRALSLSLGWLGYTNESSLKELKSNTIGREEYKQDELIENHNTGIKKADRLLNSIAKSNKLRAHIAGNYLNEMRDSFTHMDKILKPDGYVVLISGNNHVCNRVFHTTDYLNELCIEQGWKLKLSLIDKIKSRGLMTRRNKTANMINNESVLLFKKEK